MLDCILHEDDDLLVVCKPPGWNTHAPAPHAGEGLYEWLRHREPRWASLAIVHRLDKDTSGVLVFAKSDRANRDLTRQFTERRVEKRYRFRSTGPTPFRERTVRSTLVRSGERYFARPVHPGGELAVTHFRALASSGDWLEGIAEPHTGRTHQIRVHAASQGMAVLGDRLYGGAPFPRLCLHAEWIALWHPATGERVEYSASGDFDAPPPLALRAACIDRAETDAWRVVHGAADGTPGVYLDRWGSAYLCTLAGSAEALAGSTEPAAAGLPASVRPWAEAAGAFRRGAAVYVQRLQRRLAGRAAAELAPVRVLGDAPAPPVLIRENGLRFEVRLDEGYSVGLFLDQRDNRRRLRTNHIAADFPVAGAGLREVAVLNLFAYTCAFSVCAAAAGARCTSIDLSRRYLEWGRGNFGHNGLDPAAHEWLHGDAFEWLRRLGRKGRRFGVVILDPPTFSRSKEHGVFRAEKDFADLVAAAAAVLEPGGVLLASTNAAELPPAAFEEQVQAGLAAAGRRVRRRHYCPQPPDFPITREEPAYLKTLWVRT